MKILLLSDLHANLSALRAIEAAEKSFDKVLFAGDVIDYGFYPHECVRWLAEHEAISVLGNHDKLLLERWDAGFRPLADPDTATAFWEYNLSVLTPEDIEYVRAIPVERSLELDGMRLYMCHAYDVKHEHVLEGHMSDYTADRFFEEVWTDKVGALGGDMRIVYGHTHQCWQFRLRKNRMFLNPGSASYRLGPDGESVKGGDYMVIQDGEVFLRHVDYTAEEELAHVERMNFVERERLVGRIFYERPEGC